MCPDSCGWCVRNVARTTGTDQAEAIGPRSRCVALRLVVPGIPDDSQDCGRTLPARSQSLRPVLMGVEAVLATAGVHVCEVYCARIIVL